MMKTQESGEVKSPARQDQAQRCSLALQEGLGPADLIY